MDISSIDKFFYEIFKAHKKYVLEAWEKWEDYNSETLKADVENKYPNGFKDFLVEALDAEIKNNTPKKENEKRQR